MKYRGLTELYPTTPANLQDTDRPLTNYLSFTLNHSYSKLLLSIYPKYLNSTTLKLLLNAITLNAIP